MQALGSWQGVGEGGVLVLAPVLTKGMAAPQMRFEQVSKKDKKRKNKTAGRWCSSYGHCSSHGHLASPSGLTPCTLAQRDARQQLAAGYQPSRNPCNLYTVRLVLLICGLLGAVHSPRRAGG